MLFTSQQWQNDLHALIDSHLNETFSATAITVMQSGDVVFDRAWGTVDPEVMPVVVMPESLFDMASVTKLYTTTALLAVLTEKNLSLETPLVDVLPEFGTDNPRPVDGGMDPHDKVQLPTPDDKRGVLVNPAQVTLRHLLTHTSGLPPWRDVFNAASETPPPAPHLPDPIGRARRWQNALDAITHYPFVSQPDGIVRYSDIGLILLGEAVARLDGRAGQLDAVIAERVLAPIGVTDTMFNPVREHNIPYERIVATENDPTWRGRRVHGDVHDENACGIGGVAGHAGLFSTALDTARFGQAWLDDPSGIFGIRPDWAREAITLQSETGAWVHGLGWMMKSSGSSSAGNLFSSDSFGHTGFTGTSLWVDPTRRLVVACLTNRVYPGRDKAGIHPYRVALHDHIVRGVDR